MTKVTVVPGDITRQTGVDCIVNAANEQLRAGAGVCGAIFKAAGLEALQAECYKHEIIEYSKLMRCPTGGSRHTSAGSLPYKGIIHAVGPVYSDSQKERCETALYAAYFNTLSVANFRFYTGIAFPALSCGIYGYPWQEAARIAMKACVDFRATCPDTTLQEIRFVIFEPELLKIFEVALSKV